jgi:DNA-binding transcriptional ArsR family regulator
LPTQEDINKVSAVFGALSHPTRIKILLITGETKKPLHIKAVAKILKADYAAIYRHIEVLKRANLLEVYEVGRSRVLSPLHMDVVNQIIQLTKEVT